MLTTGISITRDRLFAVAVEGAASAPRVVASESVPCSEPFGSAKDVEALAGSLRKTVSVGSHARSVLSLPPSLTYLRLLKLPVDDLPRARSIHIAELEGTLPIEDEEVLSDLLPAASESPSTFVAVAARRSFVESAVGRFRSASFPVIRIVTDAVALLSLVSDSRGKPRDGLYLAAFSDLLLMRISGGGVAAARQFPAQLCDRPDEVFSAMRAIQTDPDTSPAWMGIGAVPPSLSNALQGMYPASLPPGIGPEFLPAFGAAMSCLLPGVGGGFSLRTTADAAREGEIERSWARRAIASAGAAIVLAIGALLFTRWTEGEKAIRARALVRKEFSEAAPEVRNVVQAGPQIRAKLDSLRRKQKELGAEFPPPSELLALASKGLPQRGIAVREVSIDGARLRLSGEAAGGAQTVESYRAGLADAFGRQFQVTVQEAGGSGQGGTVKFTILVEWKGGPHAS